MTHTRKAIMRDLQSYTLREPMAVRAVLLDRSNFARLAAELGAQVRLWPAQTTKYGPRPVMDLPGGAVARTGMMIVLHPDGRMEALELEDFDRRWKLPRPVVGYAPDDPGVGRVEDVVDVLLAEGLPGAHLSGPWSPDDPEWNLEANGFVVLPLLHRPGVDTILITVTQVPGRGEVDEDKILGRAAGVLWSHGYDRDHSTHQGLVLRKR